MKNIQYINAGAGSGKTTKLTQILSEELGKSDAKIRPSEVILTTFTELAASEFRERSRQQLFQDGHPDIAAELDSATIGTVHSVALSFIQRYWYLIGVSPDMKVMSEEDLQVYISESLGEYVSTSCFSMTIVLILTSMTKEKLILNSGKSICAPSSTKPTIILLTLNAVKWTVVPS